MLTQAKACGYNFGEKERVEDGSNQTVVDRREGEEGYWKTVAHDFKAIYVKTKEEAPRKFGSTSHQTEDRGGRVPDHRGLGTWKSWKQKVYYLWSLEAWTF